MTRTITPKDGEAAIAMLDKESKRIRRFNLACGHSKQVNVGSHEEAYADEHGIVQCRKCPPLNGEAVYAGINGWVGNDQDDATAHSKKEKPKTALTTDPEFILPEQTGKTTRRAGQKRTPQEKVADGKAKRDQQKAKAPTKTSLIREALLAGQTKREVSHALAGKAPFEKHTPTGLYAWVWDVEAAMLKKGDLKVKAVEPKNEVVAPSETGAKAGRTSKSGRKGGAPAKAVKTRSDKGTKRASKKVAK
jgi:hypothetical protein